MSREAAVIWRCDAPECREWNYATERWNERPSVHVSPVALGWLSVEVLRSGLPEITVELCPTHGKQESPGQFETVLAILLKKWSDAK
jgi:hypothetical protein